MAQYVVPPAMAVSFSRGPTADMTMEIENKGALSCVVPSPKRSIGSSASAGEDVADMSLRDRMEERGQGEILSRSPP